MDEWKRNRSRPEASGNSRTARAKNNQKGHGQSWKEVIIMRFEGRVWKVKGSKYWLVEVPLLDVMTQGTSKKDAFHMISDAIEILVDRVGFKVNVRPISEDLFTVGANKESTLIAFMLKRQREAHNLTLIEVARRLGQKSPNAYARYEQGKSAPTVEKLNELMKAIDPGFEPVLKIA